MQTGPVQILNTAVHLAQIVTEYPQLEDFGEQFVGLGFAVTAFGAHQYQQASADFTDCCASNHNPGLKHPLQESLHS